MLLQSVAPRFIVGARVIASADGVSIVGLPSLPASTVNAIFTHLGSPMAGNGDVIVRASRNMQIDDAFALAVWWTETNDGEAGTGRAYGDRNPAGVRGSPGYPSDYGGYTIYPSYAAAIIYWFGMIRQRYVDRGMDTVYAISYPYVGTSSSPLWAAKVIRLMLQYRGEAPPPTAIPTINSSPTVNPRPVVSPVVPGVNKKHIRPPEVDARAFSEHTQLQPHSIQVSAEPPQAAYAGWIELSVIFLAFLAAFVLAIWALRTMRSRRVVPAPMPLRTTTSLLPLAMPGQLPVTEQLQGLPLLYFGEVSGVRTTEALQGDIVAANALAGSRETDLSLRRVTLLPSQPGQAPVSREPVTVGARPAGLLTRYKEMQQ